MLRAVCTASLQRLQQLRAEGWSHTVKAPAEECECESLYIGAMLLEERGERVRLKPARLLHAGGGNVAAARVVLAFLLRVPEMAGGEPAEETQQTFTAFELPDKLQV